MKPVFRSKLAAALAASSFLTCALAPAGVVINEFMASNATTLADEDGDYEDWIELYNPTSETVDLAGWGLSDDLDAPFKWAFSPGTTIGPGAYLLVWASGKDRTGQQPENSEPATLDGLVLWLRADTATFDHGAAVDAWQDVSGRANHATQPVASQRPVFTANAVNELPAITFDRSTSQQLFLPTAGFDGLDDLSNFSIFVVARWTGGTTSGLFGGFRGSNNTNSGSSVFEITSGGLRLRLPTSINITNTPGIVQNQWQLLGAAMDGPAATASLHIDGQVAAQANGTPALTALANYDRLPIGSSHDDARTFGGQIAEVVMYDRALTTSERTRLASHFADKYALPGLAATTAAHPHTNFRISASGEPISLTRPDGTTADQVGPVEVPTDVTYGRTLADPDAWSLLQVPTPGAPNDSQPWSPPPPPVAFSHPAGVHTAPFSLTISHPDPSAVIIYTIDGSEPDIANLDGTTYQFRTTYRTGPFVQYAYTSIPYTGSIPVNDRSPDPNKLASITTTADSNPNHFPAGPVKKATVVRARAYLDGVAGPTTTATYFVSESGAFDYDLSMISLAFDEDGLFDDEMGIYIAGNDHVTSSGGRICNWANYNRRGRPAERTGHFQFFENGVLAHDQGIGIRIHGNCSRMRPFKSLRLHARTDYDDEGEIDFPFFDTPVPDAVVPENTRHKRIILRQPNINEVSFCRLYQPVHGGVGGRLRPAVKFFNGEYWGISYIRDRLDHHYLAYHYDLDPDNLTQINIKYGHEVGVSAQRVFDLDHGIPSDMDDFWAMRNFITGNDMAVPANYQQAESLLDMASFIDHLILKIFAGDDHYAPEYIFWRAREPQDAGFGDGRWRVIVKDFDSTLRTDNYVTGLATGSHPRPFGFEVFRSLLDHPSFRDDFINRFADLLNAHFQPHRFQDIIHAAYDEMQADWPEMSARWNNVAIGNPNRPFTTTNRNNLLNWSTDHPPRQRGHIRSHFGIAGDVDLTVSVADPAHGHVRVNTIDITGDTPGMVANPYPWTGVYFHNIPVKLAAIPAPGFRFTGWRLNGGAGIHSTDPQLTVAFTTATTFEAVFESEGSIHQWDFENSANFLNPSQSVGGAAAIHVEIDPEAEPEPVVLRNTAAQGFDSAHLRVNEPLGVTLTWALPTTGFGGLNLSWESRRSGSGAGTQVVEFTTDGENWQPLETYDVFNAAPQPQDFDLTGYAAAENNPDFAVRVTFLQGDGGTSGNNRFDNVALTGIPLPGGNPPATIVFDSVPAGTASGSPLDTVVVRLLDADGNPAISFNGPVTLAIVDDSALTGTLTVDAVNGTATFDDLVLTGTGLHQLTASAAGLDPATSSAIRSLALTTQILPRFIQGGQDAEGDNNDRVPFAWHARIDGLAPHATYRFGNRAVLPGDSPANDGAGNMIFATSPTENWIRTTSSPRFRPGDLGTRHFTFTAGADGSFSGWFLTEPSGNARFTPGNILHFRLLLNDGDGGEETTHVLTTTESVQVLGFGTASGQGTGIIGQSTTAARRIAVLYDEAAGTTRPLAATPVEITGAEVDSRYAAFYQNIVATNQSHWGTIIPNDLPGGLRRIEIRAADGTAALLDTRTATAGFPGTVDPGGGLNAPILLDADAGLPVFLPGGSALWHSAVNWTGGIVPNAAGATAILNAPVGGNRNVNTNAPTTVGTLRINQGATDFRNRLRTNDGTGSLTFDSGNPGTPATLRVDGAGGSGHVDLDFENPVTLASDLALLVNHSDGGDPQQGALRLQQTWTGPGGLIKQGPGLASLTGAEKSFTGPVVIEQGALRVTGPAVPAATSGVTILPGGQLRLVSDGSIEEPRVHQFGGGAIAIGGIGRGGDLPAGQELGVLGALRYDPGSQDNLAALGNPLNLTATTDIHVDGTRNTLRLDGEITGNGHSLIKTGGGTLELAAASAAPAAPAINVETGTLAITASHPAAITLAADTELTGNGTVATINGPGSVSPGKEILTATQSSAARIAAVLTTPGGTAGNGAIVLTDPANPLPAAPQSIDLFLDPSAPPVPGDRFQGGLIAPAGFDLTSALAATTVTLFLADPAGEIDHHGQSYRPVSSADLLTWSVTGNTLEVLQSGTPTAYDQWRNLHFADPAERADDAISGPAASDATGTANLLRYAFDLGPADPVAPAMPVIDAVADTFRFAHDPAKSDLAWIVRASTDLADWSDTLLDTRTAAPPAAALDGLVSIPYPADGPRLFLRLELLLLSE